MRMGLKIGWQPHEISDLISKGILFIGDGYRAKNEELDKIGLPFARAGNINEGFQFRDADCFPEENLDRVGNKISQPGDVVFTSKGTVGRFALVRHDTPRFVYSPQLCFWRVLDNNIIDSIFLYFWMFSREFFLQYNGAKGQTDMADYVSLKDQRQMHITLPPLPEQRTIARILGSLDDKIELNRRMNETLEAMARAIFKSWFVDFDPLRAKAEGREPAGMDAETAALFPDSFEEMELGMVPKRWEIRLLGQITCYVNRGMQPEYIDKGGIKVINQKCIRDHQIDWTKARRHDPSFRPINGDRELQKGDILINSTGVGTLGRVAQILCLYEKAIIDSHVTIVRADPEIITWNILGLMLFMREAEIEDLGEGTTGQTELSRERLKSLKVLVPSLSVQKSFDKVTLSLRDLIRSNEIQIKTLTDMRDVLLPKLLSGEVRAKVAGE